MEEAGLKEACLEVVGPKQAGLGKASLEKVGFEEAEVHDEQDHVNQETSTNVHHKLHEEHVRLDRQGQEVHRELHDQQDHVDQEQI